MLYSPIIVDGSIPKLDLMTSVLGVFEPEADVIDMITLGVMSVGVGLLAPNAQLGTSATLSLITSSLTLCGPTITSAYESYDDSVTGVAIKKRRLPNPYSPEEVRKAFKASLVAESTNLAVVNTLNTKLSLVQSDLDALVSKFDTFSAAVGNVYTTETDDTVIKGNLVYVKSTGHVGLANASSITSIKSMGFSAEAKGPTFAVSYVTDGRIELADWTAVLGSATLTPGVRYYASDATPGMITATAPSAGGSYIVCVGEAQTTLILDIEISTSIRI
jgi:hypothetical protein